MLKDCKSFIKITCNSLKYYFRNRYMITVNLYYIFLDLPLIYIILKNFWIFKLKFLNIYKKLKLESFETNIRNQRIKQLKKDHKK